MDHQQSQNPGETSLIDRVNRLEQEQRGTREEIRSLKRLVIVSIILTSLGAVLRIGQALHLIPDNTAPAPAVMPGPGPGGSAPSGNSNSVHIGAGSFQETRKTYFTTAEVAARESIAERTLLTWIEEGRISPAPQKIGRAWSIPVDYKISPPR